MAKPSIPQGTRDFGANVVRRRQYIFNTIRSTFELYGFEPLETPSMENLETLMGKYGEEGDKLIFRILNNGLERPEKQDKARADFETILQGKNNTGITERALRYDLTIPFARYVAMQHGKLTLPYKRYQMQPVWRADRPQKGRYREFYQCDADIVGSQSLLNETELAHLYADVFAKLGLRVSIRVNHRKILAGLAEACGCPEQLTHITVAIDKLDKIGLELVVQELHQKGLSNDAINIIVSYLHLSSSPSTISDIKNLLGNQPSAIEGINDIKTLLLYAPENLIVDYTLARGLNYYTGAIFEVKALDVNIGSIGGGGRYDDLTGLFGVPGIAGVGISFGVDRIYDCMEALQLFPEQLSQGASVLFFNLGAAECAWLYPNMQALRKAGISCEMYHEAAKMDKQFKYAEKKQVRYAVIAGSREMESQMVLLKDLQTGTQEAVPVAELVAVLQTK